MTARLVLTEIGVGSCVHRDLKCGGRLGSKVCAHLLKIIIEEVQRRCLRLNAQFDPSIVACAAGNGLPH